MPRDGSGNYSVVNTFTANTPISASAVNANFVDVGSALTASLARDGQAAMTGQLRAIAGTAVAPGIAFGVDTNTGIRRSAEDEISIVTGGTDRLKIDATGKVFALGDMNIAGDVGLTAPILMAATGQPVLELRRTENDDDPHEVELYQSGSGAGDDAALEIVGDGNNAIASMRLKMGATAILEWSGSQMTANVPLAVGASITINSAGYADFTEIAAPSNPAANTARLYAVDDSGVTRLQFRDNSGNVTNIPNVVNRQVFTASGTWNKPAVGTVAFVEVFGAGASGGRAGSGNGGGGGAGGAYMSMLIPMSALASTVAVTVGAGGAAQTSDGSNGAAGGNSSFGSHLAAGGGGGGAGNGADNGGGGGGGPGANTGNSASSSTGATGGLPRGSIAGNITGDPSNANPFGGGGGASTGNAGGAGLYGGGGGGFGSQGGTPTAGGDSVFGGAGGGGGADTSAGAAGGTAIVNGGNGGAGATGAAAATAGTAPGGGGGGSETGNSGAGARGEVRVTVW